MALALLGTAFLAEAQAQNAYLQNLSVPRYIRTNTPNPINVWVRNSTSTPITAFRVGWRWNNGAVNLGPQVNVGGGGIVINNYMNYAHPVQLQAATEGPGTLKVWVQVTGDNDQSNDTLTVVVRPVTNWHAKRVLMEIKTATWCQYCPPAATLGNTLNSDPDVVVAKFHSSDQFSSTSGTSYMNQYNAGFTPAGVIDMGESGDYQANSQHPAWSDQVNARKAGVAPVSVGVTHTYNASTRQLTVNVASNFGYAEPGDHRINAYIIENNLSGPQTNGGGNFVHQQVVRHVLGGTNGTTGVIPSSPATGTNYTHTYTYTLPEGWNPANITLVAYVFRRENAKNIALNAAKSGTLITSVEEQAWLNEAIEAYPNPFTTELWLKLPPLDRAAELRLLSLDGRELHMQRLPAGSGDRVPVDLPANLASGIYVLRVQVGDSFAEKRLVHTGR